MKKEIINIMVIFALILITLFNWNYVFAKLDEPVDDSKRGWNHAYTMNPDDWSVTQDTATGASKLQDIGNAIIGAIRAIGTIVSVAIFAVLGIKYMTGSVEEKAEYKKTMVPYLIGALLLFGITSLLGIIVNVVQSLI